MSTITQAALALMLDAIYEQDGPLAMRHTKTYRERAAQAAYARGMSPSEACPPPFHCKCVLR